MWPILAYQMYHSKTYYDFANETQAHQIVFWATCSVLVAMYGLNLFWYKFIVTQVVNLITGKKVSDKPSTEKEKREAKKTN